MSNPTPIHDQNGIDKLGGSSITPLGDLNLAGMDGIPAPETLTNPTTMARLNTPDYVCPDMCEVNLKVGDLAASELDALPEFAPDPQQPDLTQIPDPDAMDVYTNNLMGPLPLIAVDIPTDAEIAASLYPGLGFDHLLINRDINVPEINVPDLQHPDLTPDVEMAPEDRPGELDPNATEIMHQEPDYSNVAGRDFHTNFMDQQDDNSRRARKMTPLMQGIDDCGDMF